MPAVFFNYIMKEPSSSSAQRSKKGFRNLILGGRNGWLWESLSTNLKYSLAYVVFFDPSTTQMYVESLTSIGQHVDTFIRILFNILKLPLKPLTKYSLILHSVYTH